MTETEAQVEARISLSAVVSHLPDQTEAPEDKEEKIGEENDEKEEPLPA